MTDVYTQAVLQAPDGRVYGVSQLIEAEYATTQYFWWVEGNGSCDCNRAIYVNNQHGTDYDEDTCGDAWRLVYLIAPSEDCL